MTTAIRDRGHLRELIEEGPWLPGGYPKFYLTADGGVLCHEAVRDNLELCLQASDTHRHEDAQWDVRYCCINWEDERLYCDHMRVKIPCAYANDEATVEKRRNPWAELRRAGLVPAGQN